MDTGTHTRLRTWMCLLSTVQRTTRYIGFRRAKLAKAQAALVFACFQQKSQTAPSEWLRIIQILWRFSKVEMPPVATRICVSATLTAASIFRQNHRLESGRTHSWEP